MTFENELLLVMEYFSIATLNDLMFDIFKLVKLSVSVSKSRVDSVNDL